MNLLYDSHKRMKQKRDEMIDSIKYDWTWNRAVLVTNIIVPLLMILALYTLISGWDMAYFNSIPTQSASNYFLVFAMGYLITIVGGSLTLYFIND